MGLLPYNRALHPDDYSRPDFKPYVEAVQGFEGRLRALSVPYRKDHQHREWEYANVLRQLTEIYGPDVGEGSEDGEGIIRILDTGFGANYFTPMLRHIGYRVEAADSMHYGDCTPWLVQQCFALDIEVPLHVCPVQAMPQIADQTFDVTLCISVIEHVDAVDFDAAWRELVRVTRVGGYVMVTTDYFRDEPAWQASKFKAIQHTPVNPDYLDLILLPRLAELGLELVGGLDITYRGDFVENYSFVNLCLERRT